MLQLNDDLNIECETTDSFISSKNTRTPNVIDLRDFCLPTGNQKQCPHCCGYTVAGFFEVHSWKTTHVPIQLDASAIYKLGRDYKADSPTGTKLEYCLQSMYDKKYYDGNFCFIYNKNFDYDCFSMNVKMCVHQYGVFMCAFYITDEWYCLDSDSCIKKKRKPTTLGGHCVLCCGYNKQGMFIQNSWGFNKWGNYGFGLIPWKMAYKQFSYGIYIKNLLRLNLEDLYEKRSG